MTLEQRKQIFALLTEVTNATAQVKETIKHSPAHYIEKDDAEDLIDTLKEVLKTINTNLP